MKELTRTRRVGAAAVACAVILRLFAAGVPERLYARYVQPNIELLKKQETGRNVRFSSSIDTFSPNFMESPPPSLPEATEPPLPAFSGEEEIELYYAAHKNPDIPGLLSEPLSWNLREGDPAVLILHTHTTESYTRKGESYRETAAWRTLEERYNMLSVGEKVASLLEAAGISVLQDRQMYDYPSYNGSYTRARASIRKILKNHPEILLVLDLHRDASGTEKSQMRTHAVVDGKDAAQLMVVIGTNHEEYEKNLSLGLKLHAQLEQQAPGIMRPLQLRAQRFNQDLSNGALLVEVGAAGNSHAEAMLAAEELAKAIQALASGTA